MIAHHSDQLPRSSEYDKSCRVPPRLHDPGAEEWNARTPCGGRKKIGLLL